MNWYTEPVIVWTPETPKRKVWTATDTENPIIFLAWSYKTWGKKIVKAYAKDFMARTESRSEVAPCG